MSLLLLFGPATSFTGTKTQTGLGRLAITGTSTQPGTARLQKSLTKTQSGVARLSQVFTKTQTGIARLSKALTTTIPGVARLTGIYARLESGTARLSKVLTASQTAAARLTKSFTKTQPGIARIAQAFTKQISGISRIAKVFTAANTGVARLTGIYTKTQLATARLQKAVSIAQPATARLQVLIAKTQPAIARLSKTVAKTQAGIARLRVVSTTGSGGVDQSQTLDDSNFFFGQTYQPKLAQAFIPTVTAPLSKIRVKLGNGYLSTDNATLTLYSDSSGLPGTAIATADNGISGNSLDWHVGGVLCDFNWSSGPSLTTGTKYWMVFDRSGAYDDSNDYLLRFSTVASFTPGGILYWDGTSWLDGGSTNNIYFQELYKSNPVAGRARLTGIFKYTQTGTARLALVFTKTQTGTARLLIAGTKTNTGVARLTGIALKTESGTARLQKIFSTSLNGVSRIAQVFSKTNSGVARLTKVLSKTQVGVSHLNGTGAATLYGVARLQKALSTTIGGVSRIAQLRTKTSTGVSRLSKVIPSSQSGVTRLSKALISTQTGKARLSATVTNSSSGIARLTKIGVTATQTGKAALAIPISKLFDDFSSGTFSKWTTASNYTTSGGQATGSSTNASFYLESLKVYDFTDGQLSMQLVSYSAGANAFFYPIVIKDNSSNFIADFQIQGGNLNAYYNQNTLVASATYNATNHQWLRIRHSLSAGTIYWDTSTDGLSWTVFGSQIAAVPNAYRGVVVGYQTATNNALTSATIDNVNYIGRSATQPAIARLKQTITKTQLGIARLSQIFTKTQPGITRLSKIITASQAGIARLSKALSTVESGVARLSKTLTATQPAIARLAKAFSKTQPGVARLSKVLTATQAGVARLTGVATKTESGTARIQKALTLTISGVSNLRIAVTRTQAGTARLTKVVTTTLSGVGRLASNLTKTQSAVARLAKLLTASQSGVARLSKAIVTTESGIARLQKVLSFTQPGITRLASTRTSTVTGISRLAQVLTATRTGIARLAANLVRSESGTARLQKAVTTTQTGIGRLQQSFTKNISGITHLVGIGYAYESGRAYLVKSAPVPKTHIYKVYNRAGTYLGLLPNVISDFGFAQNINTTGVGITIDVAVSPDTSPLISAGSINDESNNPLQTEAGDSILTEGAVNIVGAGLGSTLIKNGNKIQVFEFSQYYPNGKSMFMGEMERWEASFGGDKDQDTIRVYAYSDGQELDNYLLLNGAASTVTYSTADPSNGMVKPAIDSYTAQGGLVKYTAGSVDATGLAISYTFNTASIYEVITTALSLAPSSFYYYVDLGTDVLYFKNTASTPDFTLTNGKHINALTIIATIENIKNTVYFSGGATAGVNLFSVYKGNSSITLYGQRLDRRSDNRVTIQATANAIGNNAVSSQQAEQYQTTVTILDTTMDITKFKPGQIVGFNGYGTFVDTLTAQIVRVEYTPSAATLTLGILPPSLNPDFEKLTRGLIAQQTVNNPSTPS
ncbi:MAG: hypothetical protein QFB87_04535 [Patescibacteria group bacterium]|nr:hypothetical protein [Patescibacteria group bacterium]